jgi:hypothetical protein
MNESSTLEIEIFKIPFKRVWRVPWQEKLFGRKASAMLYS